MKLQDKSINLRRRKFFDMVAKAGVSSAVLRSSGLAMGMLANRFASAQDAANKRVLFLSFPGGAPAGTWMPSSISNMNVSSTGYASVASYCNFYSVDVPGGGHGGTHASLGGGSNTMDVQLANVLGTSTPYSAINLGVEVGTTNDLIGRRNGQVVRPEDSPTAAFAQYFSAPPPGGAAQVLYEKQKTALDANRNALNALKTALGQEERERLDTHLAAIERIDRRLEDASQFVPAEGCANPALPSENAAGEGIKKQLMLQTDIAVAALRCGLTNVATIQLDDSQCEWRYNGSFSEGHHQTQHGRSRNDVIEIMKFLSEAGAYVIQQLADAPDPAGGKLIDSTVFMLVTEMGDGMSHVQSGAPYILATNMPGFKKGTVGGGGSNRGLLGDLARGLGLSSTMAAGDITNFDSDHSVLT
jgi:hypothetical protein